MIERFKKAWPALQELSRDLDWIENDFSLEDSTEEERSQVQQLREIARRPFRETDWRLERMLFMPINSKGRLFLNEAGRYQIEHTGKYFTSGDSCEVFLSFHNGEEKYFSWIPTSIETKNGEYYFTARPEFSMDGALVRTRGNSIEKCSPFFTFAFKDGEVLEIDENEVFLKKTCEDCFQFIVVTITPISEKILNQFSKKNLVSVYNNDEHFLPYWKEDMGEKNEFQFVTCNGDTLTIKYPLWQVLSDKLL